MVASHIWRFTWYSRHITLSLMSHWENIVWRKNVLLCPCSLWKLIVPSTRQSLIVISSQTSKLNRCPFELEYSGWISLLCVFYGALYIVVPPLISCEANLHQSTCWMSMIRFLSSMNNPVAIHKTKGRPSLDRPLGVVSCDMPPSPPPSPHGSCL